MVNFTKLKLFLRTGRNELILSGLFISAILLGLVTKLEEVSWSRSAMKGLPYGIELWVDVSNCVSLSNKKLMSQVARRLQSAGIHVEVGGAFDATTKRYYRWEEPRDPQKKGVKEVRGVLEAEVDCGFDSNSSEQVYLYRLTLRHWITKPATTWSRLGIENHPRYKAEEVLRRDLDRSVNAFISAWLRGDFSSLVENKWKKL